MNDIDNGDNNVNQLHSKTAIELHEQLHKAASHIRQLANDKRVLIEVGNRLRAELLQNGNCSADAWSFTCHCFSVFAARSRASDVPKIALFQVYLRHLQWELQRTANS